ncbi:hypothetical protein RB620_00410 [Paenibacillus sp. LHD-117]|uniref:hypothetical protein n=1 Tax=Paenibacillus sp. LHD-117 TaxID=3071412 RepID=UPI0027E0161A|nr:hypothetical protein [Paenibacillus sp. LHD-117]MDQ6417886.1 hypothetical protein [Paenibacillus sp. LHD-117]
MQKNIFMEAAEYARRWAPNERSLLIFPVEKLEELTKIKTTLPRYPVLYVTKTSYIPYATKAEILRRKDPNLFLIGGTDMISEWVAYVLTTLTKGQVYRIISEDLSGIDIGDNHSACML